MKRLFLVLVLAGLAYGGWLYYRAQNNHSSNSAAFNPPRTAPSALAGPLQQWDQVATVLGANISRSVESGREYLSEITSGQSEPVINHLVTTVQEELKDLPREQAEKIKYEFCKDVVTEYENKSDLN